MGSSSDAALQVAILGGRGKTLDLATADPEEHRRCMDFISILGRVRGRRVRGGEIAIGVKGYDTGMRALRPKHAIHEVSMVEPDVSRFRI